MGLPIHSRDGVDISPHRMSLCQKLVKKYHIDEDTRGRKNGDGNGYDSNDSFVRIRLYCTDRVTFFDDGQQRRDKKEVVKERRQKLVFDLVVAKEEASFSGKRKKRNKSARAREEKKLREVEKELEGGGGVSLLFDRVLVDAECSTDGAVRHLAHKVNKRKWGWDSTVTRGGDVAESSSVVLNEKLTNDDELEKLVTLQKH